MAEPRIARPTVPWSDPRFKWSSGADVQATWRRFGWTPPSEGRTQFFDEPAKPAFAARSLRRAK